MSDPPRFQFSVGALLILSTVVSVILGVLSLLDFGLPRELWYFLGAYAVVLATWLVIRGPTVYRNLWETRRRRHMLELKRAALAAEVRQRHAQLRESDRTSKSGNDAAG